MFVDRVPLQRPAQEARRRRGRAKSRRRPCTWGAAAPVTAFPCRIIVRAPWFTPVLQNTAPNAGYETALDPIVLVDFCRRTEVGEPTLIGRRSSAPFIGAFHRRRSEAGASP